MREIYEGLSKGSFKGVEFLTKIDETTKGNAKVNYEYINTNRRVSKYLGGIPPSFKMTIFTHGLGQDYYTKRDDLDAVLSSGSSGPLVHPFWGGPFNVSVGVYSIKQRMDKVGYCEFSVVFDVCDAGDGSPLVPQNRRSTATQNRTLANQAISDLQIASGEVFSNTTPLNYESSVGLIGNMSNAVAGTFGQLGDTISKASNYTAKALEMREKAAFYADNPLLLFAEAADLLLGVDGLTLDVFAKFVACRALFDFGESDSSYPTTTASPVRIDPDPRTIEDAQRRTNAKCISNFMRIGTTIESFAQSGNTTFETVDQIDQYELILNQQFEDIKDLVTQNPEAEIYDFNSIEPDYSKTYSAIVDLRTSVRQYMDQQRLIAPRVEIITVVPVPASVLAYQLYQDSTRAEQILELNDLRDAMVLEGEIRVLSE